MDSVEKLSKHEKFAIHNSLSSLVKALTNKYTTIDLRGESCVTGKILSADGFMNIEMGDAILYDARGVERPFETFFVNARNIRYVHIPEGTKSRELMEHQLLLMTKPQKKFKRRENTFKTARAKKYNQETVNSAYRSSTSRPSTSRPSTSRPSTFRGSASRPSTSRGSASRPSTSRNSKRY